MCGQQVQNSSDKNNKKKRKRFSSVCKTVHLSNHLLNIINDLRHPPAEWGPGGHSMVGI